MTSVSTSSPGTTSAMPSTLHRIVTSRDGRARRRPPRRRRPTRSRGRPPASGEPMRPRKLRFVVVDRRSRPAARTPVRAAEAGAARRRRDHRARLDEHVEQALVRRLALDRLRRRNDDRARARDGRVRPRRIDGGLPQVGHRAVRAVADVDLVDRRRRRPPTTGVDVARQVRQRDERLERRQVDLEPSARNAASGSERSAVHADARAAVEIRRRPSRRPGRCPSPSPPRPPCSRPRAARRPRAPPRPRRRTRAPRSSPPPTPICADHGEDHVLAGDEGCPGGR